MILTDILFCFSDDDDNDEFTCICSDGMGSFSPTGYQSWLHGMPKYWQWRPQKNGGWGVFPAALSTMPEQKSGKQKYWWNDW